ncbi:UNVERIFIED_CONTAM: hypothetical protein K2H54_062737 [Gekko kuhli]
MHGQDQSCSARQVLNRAQCLDFMHNPVWNNSAYKEVVTIKALNQFNKILLYSVSGESRVIGGEKFIGLALKILNIASLIFICFFLQGTQGMPNNPVPFQYHQVCEEG